ncbi:ArnT family glycosyltransferase [Hymenobacter sp. BT491]|uniref:ArnT family glycosyltransferase n=1 Tax=Hymenobacter sp. BT491 TaxID=2766779 RepID=UPI001653E400|nr:hypothetical protein [Hymenobacter sp. BT491]MBC6991681.1 hypothetical protein [Hymenobacter sp. BT491]
MRRRFVFSLPPQRFVSLFFGLLLLLGLSLYRDYGVSWDEPVDHLNGLVSARYVAHRLAPKWAERQAVLERAPDFENYHDNDHGVLFELPLAFWDQLRPSSDLRAFYQLRHLCIFLTCLAGTWALFRLARIRFHDWRLGLLTAGLLVLSPRMFAESFYNAKDLVFLSVFTVAMYSLALLMQRPSLWRALLHGVATAMALDMRVLGILVVGLTLGMLTLEVLFASSPKRAGLRMAGYVVAYLSVTAVVAIIGWPYLWEAPVAHFLLAYQHLSHYPWLGEVWYLGRPVYALNLPWHYALVWIVVTTPVPYVLAFCLGMLVWLYTIVRSRLAVLATLEGRLDLLFAAWFGLPLLMVILLKSVLYDGWRHLYFVYPALLLIAVRGGQALWQITRLRARSRQVVLFLGLIASLEVAHTAVRMIRMHPNQQVYFSFLSAGQAGRLFERDYWGLSYRQGVEYLLKRHPTGRIPVDSPHPLLLTNNTLLLNPIDRERFQFTDSAPNRYFLADYRMHPGPYPDSVGREVYSVAPEGLKILSVFQPQPKRP